MPLQRLARPALLTFTLVYVVLMIAGGANVTAAFQVPHDSAAAVAFVTQHLQPIRLGSFCELVSSIPLGIFMAVSISHLDFAER